MFSNLKYWCALGCIAMCLVIFFQFWRITSLKAQCKDLETRYAYLDSAYKEEQNKHKLVVAKLNAEIEKYELDKKAYQSSVAQKTELVEEKEKKEESVIAETMQADSSSEAQLNLIRRILNDFAGKNN